MELMQIRVRRITETDPPTIEANTSVGPIRAVWGSSNPPELAEYGVEFEIPSVLVWGESIRSFDALGVPIISPGLITGTLVEVDSVGGEEDEVLLAIIMIDRHILRVEVSGKVPSDAIGKPVQFEAHDLAVYDTNY
jgi:hypothetical protein